MLPPLLLPLLASFLMSSTACIHKLEFSKDVETLGESVKNCSENCSSVHLNDPCRCLNMSQEICGSPRYAIKALKSLHPRIYSRTTQLIKQLNRMMGENCQVKTPMNFCSLPVILSPKSLHKKLQELSQQISSG